MKTLRYKCVDCGELVTRKGHRCHKCAGILLRGNTRVKVVDIRKSNPCATLTYIANKIGVSLTRVMQILQEEQLPTRHYIKTTYYTCLNCGEGTTNKSGICSKKCRHEYSLIPLICEQCNIVFYRPRVEVMRSAWHKSKHTFCSKECQGKWLGSNYGKGRQKEIVK